MINKETKNSTKCSGYSNQKQRAIFFHSKRSENKTTLVEAYQKLSFWVKTSWQSANNLTITHSLWLQLKIISEINGDKGAQWKSKWDIRIAIPKRPMLSRPTDHQMLYFCRRKTTKLKIKQNLAFEKITLK